MVRSTLSLAVFGLILGACELSSTDYHYNIATSGKGEWNIDEVRVTRINLNDETVNHDTTHYNIGTITFDGTQDAGTYDLDCTIPFETFSLQPVSGMAQVSSSSIYLELNPGPGLSHAFMDCQIIKINKKEMILFSPWSLNTLGEMIYGFDFYFKLSKK